MGYQKNILVRLLDSKSEGNFPKLIKAYHTSSMSETLKLFHYMQEEEIPIKVPDDDCFGSSHNGDLFFINDIEVGFGSDESVVSIDIWASDSI